MYVSSFPLHNRMIPHCRWKIDNSCRLIHLRTPLARRTLCSRLPLPPRHAGTPVPAAIGPTLLYRVVAGCVWPLQIFCRAGLFLRRGRTFFSPQQPSQTFRTGCLLGGRRHLDAWFSDP